MDDDDFEQGEKKPRPREYTCFWDIHVQSAAVSIFLLKSAIAITCIIRNIKTEEYAAVITLIVYTSTIFIAFGGLACTQPKLYFPFIILDIIFKVIFGVFAFGLLVVGEGMVAHLDLFARGYDNFPFWFCMFMVVLFFVDVYALNIVCRSQRYMIRKLERNIHKTDAINTDSSTHEST